MRHRGTTDDVIRWWAEQNPERGHGYTGTSVRYEGPSLFSWDEEIARIMGPDGDKLAVFQHESWSRSTMRHLRCAKREWGRVSKRLFSMAYFNDPEESAKDLVRRIHSRGQSFIAGRGWMARNDLEEMKKLIKKLKELEEVFSLDSHDDHWCLPKEEEEHGYLKYTYNRKVRYYNSSMTWIVPEWIIKNQITAHRIINTRNAEVRRLATERKYGVTDGDGYEEMFSDLNAVHVHTDEYGELYHVNAPSLAGGKLALVKVANSTPEPDGTRRVFFLKVHPENRPLYARRRYNPENYTYSSLGPPQPLTAKNAVASTFGMMGDEYAPVAQT
jgi:hypothetical protein